MIVVEFTTQQLYADARKALLGVLMFVGVCVACAHCGGCAPFQEPSGVEQGYTAEIVGCAYMAGRPGAYDPVEDRACRDKVDCKYGLKTEGCK